MTDKQEPAAWLIEFKLSGSLFRHVHLHNAIGDYRMIDKDAVSIPLYEAEPGASFEAGEE